MMAIRKKKTEKSDKLKEKLLEALSNSLGIVTSAIDAVGCARSTYYDYLESDPDFKKAVDDILDKQIDFVEGHLFKQVEEGVPSSTIFYLKTKGKKRGYEESIHLKHSKGEDLPDWFDQAADD